MNRPVFLIVDDEADSARLVARLLEHHFPGSRTATAGNGPEALEAARDLQPNVLLLDAKLPGMNGFEVCARLKTDSATADILVIMYTGYFHDARHRAMGFECGADGYLCKPFEEIELVFQVRVLMRLAGLIRDLRAAKSAALVAAEAKSTLIAGMSHELRTPLNAVIGFSQVLKDEFFGSLNDRQREYLDHILAGGQTLLGLVDNVLDIANIATSLEQLEIGPIPLGSLLEDAALNVRPRCLKRGIVLETEMPPALREAVIYSDRRILRQIVFLLLSNALKFTPDNGVIRLAARRGVAADFDGAAATAGAVAIEVSDTGIGISPEKLDRLFDDFFQAHNDRNGKTPGLGLGLSLARRLVSALGGRIRAESGGPNRGSRFTFAVPAVAVAAPPGVAEIEAPSFHKEPVTHA